MKKLEFAAVATLALASASAMPTKQEIAATRPLVVELMAPAMAEYKSKTKTAAEVADVSVAFADSSKSDAAKFLFLRGAVSFYIRGGEFGKAADSVDAIKAKVKDVPPSEIVGMISGPLDRSAAQKAPRLQSMLSLAQAQVRASRDVSGLSARLKRVSTDAARRQYAEALALSAGWKAALPEFAKVSGTVGKMAKADADGSADKMALGDFWWGYETGYEGAECFFRERAAECYRKAIAEGKVDGLKKALVDQRLASLVLPDVSESAAAPATAQAGRHTVAPAKPVKSVVQRTSSSKKDPSGLVHRWSFTDGLKDSIGGTAPSKSDNAKVENGRVKLQFGSPLEFPAGIVPLPPFTLQVWVSATNKGLGDEGDLIFNVASSPDDEKDSVRWEWKKGKWSTGMWAFGGCSKEYQNIVDGKMHLYTVTCEKIDKGFSVKFYQDDTLFGSRKTEHSWKKPPMLALGGCVTPTYDEVRIYSRAFTHAEIINCVNLGPDKLPEAGKK